MKEAASRRFWITIILAFFSIDLTIAIVAISMAAGDPSFRSIPGFGKRSVQWADRQAQQRHLQELGWIIEFATEESSNERFVVRVLDSQRKPISGLQLRLEAFHFTRVADQQKMAMVEEDGVYHAPLSLHKPGYWSIEIEGMTTDGKTIWLQRRLDWAPTS